MQRCEDSTKGQWYTQKDLYGKEAGNSQWRRKRKGTRNLPRVGCLDHNKDSAIAKASTRLVKNPSFFITAPNWKQSGGEWRHRRLLR